jgi:hypothetical protein
MGHRNGGAKQRSGKVKTKFIEATDATRFNWGKFAVCRFEAEEWSRRAAVYELDAIPEARTMPLLASRGWGPETLLVLDLETGEGAMFRPGGLAPADLMKHQIWVCPMFEPFLAWLYAQDLTDIDALPGVVDLGTVPTAMQGYRRPGK